MKPTVEITNLVRDFGKIRAIDNVTLQVADGQVLALIGPNGAGKTTLLRLLCGFLAPTAGESLILGQTTFPHSPVLAGRIGCVIDGIEPPAGSDIGQIINLKASACIAFDRNKAKQLCESHRIGMKQTWRTLSKGQKRWVLAVCCLCAGADVLLLDEPADGLDPSSRSELYGLLREAANEQGTTIIVASHILSDLEHIADDVAVMQCGQIVLRGNLEDLRDRVREVEFVAETLFSIPADVTVIGHDIENRVMWLAYDNVLDVNKPLQGELQRRTVNLERLYFAITKHHQKPELIEINLLEPVT